MMTNRAAEAMEVPQDMAWEKELAPRVTRGQIVLAALAYAVWTIFLAYLAIDRWFGGLQ